MRTEREARALAGADHVEQIHTPQARLTFQFDWHTHLYPTLLGGRTSAGTC